MKILAVDTSTRCRSVALMDDAAVLAHDSCDDGAGHSGALLPAIHNLLESLQWSLSVVEGLAVSAGPGSFTGLRAGLATMLGLRLVTGLPLVTVPTLEAMAWCERPVVDTEVDAEAGANVGANVGAEAGAESFPLCPMLAARAKDVYWARFEWRDGHPVRLTDDRVGTVRDVAAEIRQPTMLFGEGWLRHQTAFAEALGELAVPGASGAARASAVEVGLAGMALFRAGVFAGPRVTPRYAQPSEAERQWDLKHGRRASS